MKQIDLPLYKFYLIEGMTQEDLNELALERNNLSEEVYRLNNIIKEVREYIDPIVELDNDIMLKGRVLKPVLEMLDKVDKEK